MPARKTPPNPPLDETPNDGTQTDVAKAAISVFNPDFDTLNLWGKIARITGMIGGVEKRGYNAFHKYNYTLESDLVAVVRQYLAAANIVIIPNVVGHTKEGELTILDIEYTVTDGNEHFSFHIPGYGADRGDKGVYKAITGSNKYALMKLFKIETGDDPEGDTRVDERAMVSGDAPAPTRVTSGSRAGVKRGGHTELASPIQIRRISEVVKELDLDRSELVRRLNAKYSADLVLGDDDAVNGLIITNYIKALTSEAAGDFLVDLTDEANVKEAPEEGPYG